MVELEIVLAQILSDQDEPVEWSALSSPGRFELAQA